jgi:hypothetical protein
MVNNGTLQVQHMEGGLTAGDISVGMLNWYTI